METGTFITRDPLGFVDGPNMYTYVVQNPWTKFDPKGLSEKKDDSERQKIRDAIDAYSNTKAAKTKLGKRVLGQLNESYNTNRISVGELKDGVRGEHDPNSGAITVSAKIINDVNEAAVTLAHEGLHSVQSHDGSGNKNGIGQYSRQLETEAHTMSEAVRGELMPNSPDRMSKSQIQYLVSHGEYLNKTFDDPNFKATAGMNEIVDLARSQFNQFKVDKNNIEKPNSVGYSKGEIIYNMPDGTVRHGPANGEWPGPDSPVKGRWTDAGPPQTWD